MQLGNIAKKKFQLLGLAKKLLWWKYFFEDMDNCFDKSSFFNRTPSRLETHLVYKHTQKAKKLISNAR